jgi:hypothetical protein
LCVNGVVFLEQPHLDKTIVHTRGGVICKFDKAKWQRFVELSKKNQQQNQQEGGK